MPLSDKISKRSNVVDSTAAVTPRQLITQSMDFNSTANSFEGALKVFNAHVEDAVKEKENKSKK